MKLPKVAAMEVSGSRTDREEAQAGAAPRRALVVVGMHRSGTSALAGVLQLLGVELGRKLLAARPGVNDKGFFELERVFRNHNALLESLGSAWDDVAPLPEQWWLDARAQPFRAEFTAILREEFATVPLICLKDPRLCRTLPLWKEILREEGIELCPVLIGRAPEQVSESLRRVHGIAAAKARALWLRHVLDGERATRGLRRVLVTYDQLLEDWAAVVARIADRFALEWPRALAAAADDVRAFLDRDLDRSRAPPDRGAESDASSALDATWRLFTRAAAAPAGAGEPFDLSAELDAAARPFEEMLRSADTLVADLREKRLAVAWLSATLTQLKELAAARDRELASCRTELATFRSLPSGSAAEFAALRSQLASLQSELAAGRASIRRRRKLLRRTRRLLAWRLLRVWRALLRRARRIGR